MTPLVVHEPAAGGDGNGPGTATISAVLATLPPLTNLQRRAFREQFTLAECDAAAARAEPRALLSQALAWFAPIERTLTRQPLLVRRYGRARFAWLLECTRDLGESLQIRDGGLAVETSYDRRERMRRAAMRLREELIEALSILAAHDEKEAEHLQAAGEPGSEDQLGASLHALARLAEDWIERDGPLTRALVASVDLTPGDVEAARAAAHSVSDSHLASDGPGDLRGIGRAAGRVALELRLVMRFFKRAHTWDPRVPDLRPALETQAALEG